MKVLGLVGGVASGKSLVASKLAELGAEVLDADQMAHQVLDEPEVIQQAVNRWGESILNNEGGLSRLALAQRVFGGPEATPERDFLESLIHPRVRQRIHQRLAELRASEAVPVVVLDIPLLLEGGYDAVCDAIWMIDTPDEVRREQAQRRGMSVSQWQSREESQAPLTLKRSQAHEIIQNHGDGCPLRPSVDSLWQSLVQQD